MHPVNYGYLILFSIKDFYFLILKNVAYAISFLGAYFKQILKTSKKLEAQISQY